LLEHILRALTIFATMKFLGIPTHGLYICNITICSLYFYDPQDHASIGGPPPAATVAYDEFMNIFPGMDTAASVAKLLRIVGTFVPDGPMSVEKTAAEHELHAYAMLNTFVQISILQEGDRVRPSRFQRYFNHLL
jgi:hypothetical protein